MVRSDTSYSGESILTVLASLVLVVTESTVKGGELTKLVALELVLTLRNGGSL
jgi:hypothetical protein